jgi:hypothetical protein
MGEAMENPLELGAEEHPTLVHEIWSLAIANGGTVEDNHALQRVILRELATGQQGPSILMWAAQYIGETVTLQAWSERLRNASIDSREKGHRVAYAEDGGHTWNGALAVPS